MCAGSHITTEMVRRLESHDEHAEFFGVVNTYGLYTVTKLYYLNRFLNVLRWYAARIRGLLSERAGAAPRSPRTASAAAVPQAPAEEPADDTAPQHDTAVGLQNPWIRDVGFAHRNPQRPKLDSPITVFRIRRQPFWRQRDRALGWGLQSKSARAVMLSGRVHLAILREPQVRDVATAIGAALADARRRGQDDEAAATRDTTMGITA